MTGRHYSQRAMPSEAVRIQSYLRATAARLNDAVHVPPFTAFIRPESDLAWLNYAVPDSPVGGDLSTPLARLRATFASRDRVPRFEWVESFAPDLAASLRATGYAEQLRMPLMVCERSEHRTPGSVSGLIVERLTRGSRVEVVQEYLTIGRRAFGSGNEEPVDEDEAVEYRKRLDEDTALLGYLDGDPAAVAQAMAPLDDLAEIVGIATLTEFRGMGLGSYLTAEATRAAFERGAEVAFLTPGSDGAFRIYERAGYRAAERMLAYISPEADAL
jgi:ribosomal protein S18 acetylase RimI-like enzyme